MRIAAALVLWTVLAIPAQAIQDTDYGRIYVACRTDANCETLVVHLARLEERSLALPFLSEEYFASVTVRKWWIATLKRAYPGVWEAQHCPLGDCRPIFSTQELD